MPSSAELKAMCAQVATFYLDHALDFPSKAAITRFSEQCASHYDRTKRRLKEAFATRKSMNKSIKRPLSGLPTRSESKLSESYKGKSLTPRSDMMRSSSRSSSMLDGPRAASTPKSKSRFVPEINFHDING